MSQDARPHWAVYVLASIMGLAFLGCVGLFVAAELGEAERNTWRWGFVDGSGDVVMASRNLPAARSSRRFLR